MRYCKKCVMPDTRPGIYFNDEGICQGCLTELKKDETDWDARSNDLINCKIITANTRIFWRCWMKIDCCNICLI